MLEKVVGYISQHRLFVPQQHVMLAVSGGADSMCMADILLKLGYQCTVLHCNFHLRAEESDGDESFVKDFFKEKCHVETISFDTVKYAKEHHISIEMAARDLRYSWFEQMSSCKGSVPVCTAHNKNDNAETLLLNLCRGTGMQGLTGIKSIRDIYRRPMLDCTRNEIEAYCSDNHIPYRTDSSNLESFYQRNKIRNKIIPLLNEINPRFIESVQETILKLQTANDIYIHEIERLKKDLIQSGSQMDFIDVARLRNKIGNSFLFFDIVKDYNCTFDQAEKIFTNIGQESNKTFQTSSHIFYRRSNSIEIYRLATITHFSNIPDITQENSYCRFYTCSIVQEFPSNRKVSNKIYLDADTVHYPMSFRHWHAGDKMQPMGMNGRNKKISDLLNEQKLVPHIKSNKQVLTCGERIIWAIGNRIDWRFAVSEKTRKILCIEFLMDF